MFKMKYFIIIFVCLIFFARPSFSQSSSSKSNEIANCKPGFSKSSLDCEPQSCTHKVENEVYKFPVFANYDENKDLAIYYVAYNASKDFRLAIYSISLLDYLNHQVNIDRNSIRGWYNHPCPDLVKLQRAKNEFYTDKGYQRGHFTPFKSMSINAISLLSTNLFVNIAPQDSYTNNIWGKFVENKIYNLFIDRFGIVISGICTDFIRVKNDLSNQAEFQVPACFWKLVCFKQNGQTKVFGYYADNSYIPNNDDLKQKRQQDVRQIFSQKDILTKTKISETFISTAWQESNYLRESRKRIINDIDIKCGIPVNMYKQSISDK